MVIVVTELAGIQTMLLSEFFVSVKSQTVFVIKIFKKKKRDSVVTKAIQLWNDLLHYLTFFEIQCLVTRSGFCDGWLEFAQTVNCYVHVSVHMCIHYLCDMWVFVCVGGWVGAWIKAWLQIFNLPDLANLVARHPVFNFEKSLLFHWYYRK